MFLDCDSYLVVAIGRVGVSLCDPDYIRMFLEILKTEGHRV